MKRILNSRILILFLTALLLASSLVTEIQAEIVWHMKETAVDFLRYGVGGRATGMGESYAAAEGDIFSSYWNPAGLAKIEKPQFAFMHSIVPVNTLLEFIGFGYPLKNVGFFALSGFFNIPESIPITDNVGQTIGELKWLNYALTLSYARRVYAGLSLGLSAKIVQMRESDPIFGGAKGTAYGGDLGLLYATPLKGLNLGFALLNYGTKLQMEGEKKEDDLPRTIKAGFAYKMDLFGNNYFILSLDENKVLSDKWRLNIGSEVAFFELVFVRFGYYEKEGNVAGTTYGVGVKFKNYEFDFTNIPISTMIGYERSNKISLTFSF